MTVRTPMTKAWIGSDEACATCQFVCRCDREHVQCRQSRQEYEHTDAARICNAPRSPRAGLGVYRLNRHDQSAVLSHD